MIAEERLMKEAWEDWHTEMPMEELPPPSAEFEFAFFCGVECSRKI